MVLIGKILNDWQEKAKEFGQSFVFFHFNLKGGLTMKSIIRTLLIITGTLPFLFAPQTVLASEKKVKITYADWHLAESPSSEQLLGSVEIFEAKNPNIDVIPQPVSLKERDAKFMTAIEAGHGPDVYHIDDPPRPGFIKKGYAKDITPFIEKEGKAFIDKYFESAWNAMKRNGRYYGMPNQLVSMVLVYNSEMFKAAGLDPNNPPKTWEDFRSCVNKLTRDTNGDGKIDQWGCGFVFGPASFHLRFSALLYSLGGNYVSDDGKKSLMNSTEVKEALQFLVDLKNDGVFPPGIVSAGCHDVRILLANKKIGMIVGSQWTPGICDSVNPNLNADEIIEMAPLPGKPVTCAHFTNWTMNRNTKNADAAWEFMKYMSSDERMKRMLDSEKMLSANKAVSMHYPPIVNNRWAKVISSQLRNAKPIPQITAWPEVQDLVRAAVQDALTKKKTVSEALEQCHMRVQQILDRD